MEIFSFLDTPEELHSLWYGFYYALFDSEIMPDFVREIVTPEFHYYLLGRCGGNLVKQICCCLFP